MDQRAREYMQHREKSIMFGAIASMLAFFNDIGVIRSCSPETQQAFKVLGAAIRNEQQRTEREFPTPPFDTSIN